ncbi:MAG: hypothetical protein RIM23_14615 [Coleofasciculus sp. G3-WIS-01]|uniref:hypothetical protein n=1 Tax=Coleofasciculus sp. G3-WIS-01 TaxID=3069528 RepID=UPI0032F921F0
MNKKPHPVLPYFVAIFCVSTLYHWTDLATVFGDHISDIIFFPRIIIDLLLLMILQIIPFLLLSKMGMVAGMPQRPSYLPINSDNYDNFIEFLDLGLNTQALAEYTLALEDLCFVHLMDFKYQDEKIKTAPCFGRLFLHPELNCFVEVSQIFHTSKSFMTMRYVFISLFVDDWSLSSSNSQISRFLRAISYLGRSPRDLEMTHLHTTIAELLQLHLENRHKIASNLGLMVKTNLDAETFIHKEKEHSRLRYQILRQKNTFVIFWGLLSFMLHPKSQWLGDYSALRCNKVQ